MSNTPLAAGTDPFRLFADAIYQDLGAPVSPIADGELHRFDDPDTKRNNAACWYVLHLDGLPAGAYGNWRTGTSYTWRANTDREITQAERERINSVVRVARQKRLQEKAKGYMDAQQRAGVMWRQAVPATTAHPYLAAKGIYSMGLRQAGDVLLVPLTNIGGELVNLQTIRTDGKKLFLKGGRITGCFCLTGGAELPHTGTVHIAEGFATAATIAQTLRAPVVAAMNAGNLKPVAEAIRAKRPSLAIIIAADNNWRTPGNPGTTKAEEAAVAVGGAVTWPAVCMRDYCRCTDFNDM